MKPIVFSHHAEERMTFRGASKAEIIDTIENVPWKPAELGRLECRKDFGYNKMRQEKIYQIKQVRPIFAEEENRLVVVTVYVYYF